MAARDRYTTSISCPKCMQPGVLHLSEDDYPFMGDPRIEIDKIEGEFSAEALSQGKVKVSCKKCGTTIIK